ncbi:MAG TPA: hypothetical protein VM597_37935 [Gemmataceae bacterium]|jgi:hypothetical protein|nr:hypothetical protein [Gemmataceae bacterium]
MSRTPPPSRQARTPRSLTAALDDFADEKKSADRPRSSGGNAGFYLLAVLGLLAFGAAGYALFTRAGFKLPRPEIVEKAPEVGYVSMDEIKANAAKVAEETGAKMARSNVRRDVPRANAKDGQFEVLDGVQARVQSVTIEREYRVGNLMYRRKTPLLRIGVSFQMAGLGKNRAYDFNSDKFPVARMIDGGDRPYPQLDTGFTGKFTSTLRFDKPEMFYLYFDPPAKTQPLYLDIRHPAVETGEVFRFFIPDDYYNVNR